MKVLLFGLFGIVIFLLTDCQPSTSNTAGKKLYITQSLKRKNIEITIPEAYELSNIVLALTKYGTEDQWEVQKNTAYYKEVVCYFAPVKDHALLKKVNYSRELWKDYLSFRTDACAFGFDSIGQLYRIFTFYTNEGHQPFDDNLDLLNDFIKVSHFREFYAAKKPFYDSILVRYSSYYMLSEIRLFLDNIGEQHGSNIQSVYKIILSPLVGRMNCHRNLDSITTADFPDISKNLLSHQSNRIDSLTQAHDIHTVFTEMDHGYVNPISDNYSEMINKKFNYKYWDSGSGYEGINCFNEYMTWALYDLFIDKYFRKYSKRVTTDWHYQNSSRGFYASSLFAAKLKEIFLQLKHYEKLEAAYPHILAWCSAIQKSLSLPVIALNEDSIYKHEPGQEFSIPFSEPMYKTINKTEIFLGELENGAIKEDKKMFTLSPNDIQWKGNTMIFKKNIEFPKFFFLFNWWGISDPMKSEKGIMLKAPSYVKFKIK